MSQPEDPYAWLPPHHEEVVYTLAHADALLFEIGTLTRTHSQAGAFEFRNVASAELSSVEIKSIRPLAPAIRRLIADCLNQLRAALEHTIMAEVTFQVARSLTDDEERAIEMPVKSNEKSFTDWTRHRHRKTLPPLRPDGLIGSRIRALQPFASDQDANTPMRLLAAYTNQAKHRAPVIAATHVGAVIPAIRTSNLAVPSFDSPVHPAQVGDVLATGPRDETIPLDIWPTISMQRPTDGSWHIVMHELDLIAEWVRLTAIPTLIVGSTDVKPLPPHINLHVGYSSIAEALQNSGQETATQRNASILQAAISREGLVELVTDEGVGTEVAKSWVDSMSDTKVANKMKRINPELFKNEPWRARDAIQSLAIEASKHSPVPGTPNKPQ